MALQQKLTLPNRSTIAADYRMGLINEPLNRYISQVTGYCPVCLEREGWLASNLRLANDLDEIIYLAVELARLSDTADVQAPVHERTFAFGWPKRYPPAEL